MPVNQPNLSKIADVPPLGDDERAQQELRKIYNETKRNESAKNVVHYVFLVFILVASLNAIAVIAIRVAHLALPAYRQWLSVDQIQSIDKLFFSGVIGGFIANHFKKVERH